MKYKLEQYNKRELLQLRDWFEAFDVGEIRRKKKELFRSSFHVHIEAERKMSLETSIGEKDLAS